VISRGKIAIAGVASSDCWIQEAGRGDGTLFELPGRTRGRGPRPRQDLPRATGFL